jgi:hypothetical protein
MPVFLLGGRRKTQGYVSCKGFAYTADTLLGPQTYTTYKPVFRICEIILLVDGKIRIRIRIWIRTNKLRISMRIQEARKHMDPTDLDPDADPEN